MVYTILNLLLLIGGIQGVLFAIITFFSKRFSGRSNFYLGLLILGFSLNNLQYYLLNSDLITDVTFFRFIFIPYAAVSMVFYYFYVKTFLNSESTIKTIEKYLFLPFLFFLSASIFFKIGDGLQLFSDANYRFFGDLLLFYEWFSWVFSFFLLLLIFRQIKNFENKETAKRSIHGKMNLRWLKGISLLSLFLCVLWMVAIIDSSTEKSELPFYLLWVGMSVTIYIMGHIGLYKFGIITEQKSIREYYTQHPIQSKSEETISHNNHTIDFERFVKIEKNYLNGQLSLDTVAETLGMNKTYLSRLVNQELGVSFTDYINQLRVEEAKEYFNNPNFSHYTIKSIGFEAGFNSKSTFNSVFKKFTDYTPTEYRKMINEVQAVS